MIAYGRDYPEPELPDPFASVADPFTPDGDTRDGCDTDLLAGVRDGVWLDAQTFPPLRYAVPGLIPEGLTLLIGPPKAGKSWLVLDLLLGLAAGGYALGRIPAGPARRVLYLALEDGDRRMQDRCRALLGPDAPIPELFHYVTAVRPGAVLATVAAFLTRHPDTALVVVDTLGKVMPAALPGESAYQRDYRIGSALKQVADSRPGLAVVVCHHDRKAAAEDFVDGVSGTHGLAGAADTIVVLARKRQAPDGLLRITGRDVPENDYAVRLAEGRSWILDGATLVEAAARAAQREAAGQLGETSTGILEFVRESGPVRARDVTEKFGEDARQYLKRLTDAGRMTRVGRGLYTVSQPSQVSYPQVNGPDVCDTTENECHRCGQPLAQLLVDAGHTVHMNCEEPG